MNAHLDSCSVYWRPQSAWCNCGFEPRASPIKAEVTTGEEPPIESLAAIDTVRAAPSNEGVGRGGEGPTTNELPVNPKLGVKAEGEVTTVEAELLRDIQTELDVVAMHSTTKAVFRRCRAMIADLTSQLAMTQREYEHSTRWRSKGYNEQAEKLDEALAANASLRAKLDERDAELYTLQHLTWHMFDDSEEVGDTYIVDRTDVEAVWALLPEGHPQPRQSAQAASQLRGALEVISEEPDLDSAHLIARRALGQGEAK